MDELGIGYQNWDFTKIKEKFPILDNTSYYPPRRPEDPNFGKKNESPLSGAVYYHEGGYISDPTLSTHNVQVAAEDSGAEFKYNAKVVNILKQDNRIKGVELEDATVIEAPVVVNASGPHSFIINRLAGVEEGMQIKTRALRHEVVHLPAPSDVDYESIGCPSSDSDIGGYWRPEVGNNILSGSEDPECDPKEWVENPVVFRLKHLKRDINLKFYSRLREINKESSFSVLG